MNIGVDLDSVIAETMSPLMIFFNAEFNTNYKTEDVKEYDLDILWQCSRKKIIKTFAKFYNSTLFEKIKPISNSRNGIKYLSQKYPLFLITARPTEIEYKTEFWINRFFPNSFKEIYHTNQGGGCLNKISKSKVCRKKNISLMIDDHLMHAHDCVSEGMNVLLKDMPWNKNAVLPKQIKRFYSWKEIKKLL